ncbi:MAG: WG repeat-containing protein [Alistipes sp.]
MFTLRQYLTSLDDPRGLLRTLREVEVCRDALGRMCYWAGNSAVVFRIRHAGCEASLRCYFRPMRHLTEIYGSRLLPQELYLYTSPTSGIWVDVVIGAWIEGITLHQAITQAALARNTEQLAALSARFDSLAAELTADAWAHGDLKPENILVEPSGALRLIDFDAQFLPAFAGETSPELGTAAYQHPARTAADFDASLDDYPAALIATALHALTLDPTLYDRYRAADGLLFTPTQINTDAALREVFALFEGRGLAVYYRIAELLLSPTLRLFGLSARLSQAAQPTSIRGDEVPELFVENGLWGYRTPQRIVVPPLYDCGFDFSDGLAAVQLHTVWHFIDTTGRTVISCPDCQAVKPFDNGRAQIIRNGRRVAIDHTGREIDSQK